MWATLVELWFKYCGPQSATPVSTAKQMPGSTNNENWILPSPCRTALRAPPAACGGWRNDELHQPPQAGGAPTERLWLGEATVALAALLLSQSLQYFKFGNGSVFSHMIGILNAGVGRCFPVLSAHYIPAGTSPISMKDFPVHSFNTPQSVLLVAVAHVGILAGQWVNFFPPQLKLLLRNFWKLESTIPRV